MTTIVRVSANPTPGLRAEATIEHVSRGVVTASEVRVLDKKGGVYEFAVHGGIDHSVRVSVAEVAEDQPGDPEGEGS